MAKITLKGGIYYDADVTMRGVTGWDRYRFFPGDLTAFSTYVPVCAHEFTVDIGDFDHRPEVIRMLEAKRKELHAQFAAAVTEINRQINELQAIEMSEVA